jgi:phospholipase A1
MGSSKNRKSLCAAALALASATPAYAQLTACAPIVSDAERLACYDGLARAASAPPAVEAAPPTASATATQRESAAEPPPVVQRGSTMDEHWELRRDLKRGIFNLVPHRPLYGLIHWTDNRNELPSSPTRSVTQQADLERAEGKIQLSFKTKMAEGILGTPGDLWFGYTQVSYWQVGNQRNSSPFRETNYEPEATLIYPLRMSSGDFRMRFAGLTLNHQSNGRSGAFSRSWNRLIGEVGAEYGNWSFHARPWLRVLESSPPRDDNPDIENYAGRGELVVTRRAGGHVLTLTGRHTLRGGDRSRGSLRFDYALPVVGALNLHFQVFSGYGLNLIDYNHRQTTFGIGVSFLD